MVDYDADGTGLPRADVLEYRLVNGAKLMVRPSGTEPKIKVYLSAVAGSEEAADAINTAMADAATDLIVQIQLAKEFFWDPCQFFHGASISISVLFYQIVCVDLPAR